MEKPVGWPMEAGNYNRYLIELLGCTLIYEISSDIVGIEFTIFPA